jgi:hypothetical protein
MMEEWGKEAETILIICPVALDPLFHSSSIPTFSA